MTKKELACLYNELDKLKAEFVQMKPLEDLGVNMPDLISIPGWMFPSELEWLKTKARESSLILEIGIWKGRSTSAICEGVSSHPCHDGKVIAVDNWSGSKIDPVNYKELDDPGGAETVEKIARENLKSYLDSGILKILKMSSDNAFEVMQTLGYKPTMIFIDGDHDEDQVKKDICNALIVIENGGLLCGHDYQLYQIRSAVNEFLPDHSISDTIWWKRIYK
jgi:hypothetical protein